MAEKHGGFLPYPRLFNFFFRFFHRKCKEANKQEKSGLGNYFAEADVFKYLK
jgi:hypothetical protein